MAICDCLLCSNGKNNRTSFVWPRRNIGDAFAFWGFHRLHKKRKKLPNWTETGDRMRSNDLVMLIKVDNRAIWMSQVAAEWPGMLRARVYSPFGITITVAVVIFYLFGKSFYVYLKNYPKLEVEWLFVCVYFGHLISPRCRLQWSSGTLFIEMDFLIDHNRIPSQTLGLRRRRRSEFCVPQKAARIRASPWSTSSSIQ